MFRRQVSPQNSIYHPNNENWWIFKNNEIDLGKGNVGFLRFSGVLFWSRLALIFFTNESDSAQI